MIPSLIIVLSSFGLQHLLYSVFLHFDSDRYIENNGKFSKGMNQPLSGASDRYLEIEGGLPCFWGKINSILLDWITIFDNDF
jgi:hypothetical protein